MERSYFGTPKVYTSRQAPQPYKDQTVSRFCQYVLVTAHLPQPMLPRREQSHTARRSVGPGVPPYVPYSLYAQLSSQYCASATTLVHSQINYLYAEAEPPYYGCTASTPISPPSNGNRCQRVASQRTERGTLRDYVQTYFYIRVGPFHYTLKSTTAKERNLHATCRIYRRTPHGEPRTFYVENTIENIPRPPQAIVLNNILFLRTASVNIFKSAPYSLVCNATEHTRTYVLREQVVRANVR